jgi:hypothetical protein
MLIPTLSQFLIKQWWKWNPLPFPRVIIIERQKVVEMVLIVYFLFSCRYIPLPPRRGQPSLIELALGWGDSSCSQVCYHWATVRHYIVDNCGIFPPPQWAASPVALSLLSFKIEPPRPPIDPVHLLLSHLFPKLKHMLTTIEPVHS